MKRWEESEIEILHNEYNKVGAIGLCSKLNRSQSSITGKARKLGLFCENYVTPVRNMVGENNPNWKNGKSSLIKSKGKVQYRPEYFYSIKRLYGLDEEGYNKLFEKQQGCCVICGRHQDKLDKKLSVDHDHNTGAVRGLLCTKCNSTLGWYELNKNNFVKYCKS